MTPHGWTPKPSVWLPIIEALSGYMELSASKNKYYKYFCIFLSLTAYIWSSFFPPMMHGGTLEGTIFSGALIVTGGYCTVEWFRSETQIIPKILIGLWCTTFIFLIGMGIYFAIPKLFSMLTT